VSKFAEKTDYASLKGAPKDFHEAGLGQFNNGIIEFVKVSKQDPWKMLKRQ